MTTVLPGQPAGGTTRNAPGGTFDSLSPLTGEVVGTYPINTADEVTAAVGRAREAAIWWRDLGFDGRQERMLRWKGIVTRNMKELAEVVRAETGKPLSDAQLEIVLAIEHIDWAARHAKKVLGRHRRSSGLLLANNAASVEYQPVGVVGAIGPWNYPVYTPLGTITYALAAGNAVVHKPSEYTPGVGKWLVGSFCEAVPEQPVLQLLTGFGVTGSALVTSGVDKLAFTGSATTGKKVMAAAAQTLTPVVIEGGGKDALIVDADADLDAAADATVWGAFSNAGQTCAGVERVYVHQDVYSPFLDKVVELAKTIRGGVEDDAHYGPMTMPSQIDVVRRHIDDAIARGGKALVGGPEAVGERIIQPTVLVDVPEDSAAVREETFGPTVTIAKVRDMDEAIAKSNDSPYGLGGTVFSRKRGLAIAAQMNTGAIAINAPLSFAGISALPFGGHGDSGFGRIHGPEGLREFSRPRAIARQRFAAPLALTTFRRKKSTDRLVAWTIRLLHGRKK